ncbi:MAG TPA: glycoside hydrolase [Thermoanaerobaculia bacterium]|nr:glycoside hydrolase [Thermoanaerobaculia bacterium]
MLKRIAFLLLLASTATAQVDPHLFQEMRWRMIGPFRGGRTVAAAGVRGEPNVFYIGANDGGVWKTTDFGRVWTPIFDSEPTGSIGALAVAPSNPDILYVGSGEGLQRPDLSTGDGIYKSLDAGRTWQHLGLRDGQQIPMIAVDPHDPNRIFVAVLGHPYGPNEQRGIFRSTDGGATFQKVLYKDENTGGMDVALDPSNPETVYAVLWEARQGPWENAAWTGPNSGLFKSTDGGSTWTQLTAGLPGPAEELGRIGIDVAQADPKRIYAVVGAKKGGGIYRSDDAGASWQLLNSDERLWGRDGDFNEIRSDPKNPDVVYVANIVTWKSVDGGKSWSAFRGAPGGDDYHRVWINPDDPNILLIAADQGAIVTVNGGATWSSWYNQPTAQFYHVNTDNDFPYRVCGGQQESGSACVQSRGDDGQITFREWHPVGVEEYGYAVPDPLDPNIVFGGRLERYDRRTDQVTNVAPKVLRSPGYRVVRTQPVVFSPADPHILYFASNTVWKTVNRGQSWTEISPDLTRKTWAVPASVGKYTPEVKVAQRGVIYTIAPSPLDVNRIWAGTDDGLIHVTTDGGNQWKDVTPPQLVPWAKVSIMEASHFDPLEAWAAINTFRLDELRPHVLRTRDGGKSWTEIVNGLPDDGNINVVREDPKTRGLLFAGSEQAAYVSFDDGDHWQSLRLNMPAISIRDLVVHDEDLVAGTHGRGFWILDDLEPLRQAKSVSGTTLLEPERAWRFRWNKNSDTPLPPDEPAGQNPPDGAIIDYSLAEASPQVTLEILDAHGNLVRRYSSSDPAEPPKDTGNVPWYWIRPPQVLSGAAGMHRFVWDLHYTPLPGSRAGYPIAAIAHDTAPAYSSPWVMPGTYTVKLTANGRSMTRPLAVEMDPRVKTPTEGLQRQFTLSKELYDALLEASRMPAPLSREAQTAVGSLRSVMALLQRADVTPSAQATKAAAEALAAWRSLQRQ